MLKLNLISQANCPGFNLKAEWCQNATDLKSEHCWELREIWNRSKLFQESRRGGVQTTAHKYFLN